MTDTALAPAYLEPALLAAAESAAATLASFSDNGWAVQPGSNDTIGELGSESRAISLGFGGVGRLILCVGAPLARAVQIGPPPADDLLDGLTPALRAAAAALVAAFGSESSAPVEVPVPGAFQTRAGEQLLIVTLVDGGAPAGALALACPLPGPEPAQDDPGVSDHRFAALAAAAGGPAAATATGLRGPIDLLSDVEMGVTAELGRTRMLVRDILELSSGSVIELDRAAGSPIDVLVNGTLIARGEVVVIDEEFGIRITEVLGYDADRGPASGPRS